jgi:hypothetical protein
MSANIVPLQAERHGKMKLSNVPMVDSLREQHIIPLSVPEYARAAAEFPVVFVKNTDSDRYQSVALLGLKPGENQFIKGDSWTSLCIPALVTQVPLKLLGRNEGDQKMIIGVDEDSPLLNEETGERLFDDEGKETPYLQGRKEALMRYYEGEAVTLRFTAQLAELGLLAERSLTLESNGEKIRIDGIYCVDDAKLRDLDDEVANDLRKRGLLQAIYAHLVSLHQLPCMARANAQARAAQGEAAAS